MVPGLVSCWRNPRLSCLCTCVFACPRPQPPSAWASILGLEPPSDLLALAKAPSWRKALFSVPVLCPAQFLWRLWLPQRPGSLFPALCTGWRWAGGEVSESPAGEALLMKLLQLPSGLLLAFPSAPSAWLGTCGLTDVPLSHWSRSLLAQ